MEKSTYYFIPYKQENEIMTKDFHNKNDHS